LSMGDGYFTICETIVKKTLLICESRLFHNRDKRTLLLPGAYHSGDSGLSFGGREALFSASF